MEGSSTWSEEDAAAKAYAAMSNQLNEWTSPFVGTVSNLSMGIQQHDNDEEDEDEEDDVMNWMQQQDVSSPVMNLTPQKRTSGIETPVMSNHSKRHQRQPSPLELDSETFLASATTTPEPMDVVGVQTPWQPQQQQEATRMQQQQRSTRMSDDNHYEFRRYHDALYTYLAARRNVSERLRIQQEQQQQTLALLAPMVDESLVNQETRIEMDLLQALSAVCLDTANNNNNSSMREGNFWSLLATLRSLGLSSLLFADDAVHQAQYQAEMEQTIHDLALQNTDKSPFELFQELSSSDKTPMVWRRRKLVLEWMQQCQSLLLPQVTMPSMQTNMWPSSLARLQQPGSKRFADKVDTLHPDAPLLVRESCRQASSVSVPPIDPLYGTDEAEDAKLLEACLALLLAGQSQKAVELCRQCGQAWRAAAWMGGIPYGIRSEPNATTQTMDRIIMGNANRALWKRNCWNLAETLSTTTTTATAPTGASVQYEAVIYAYLSHDTARALSSPVVTTLEQQWQIILSAVVGRMEDSLLFQCNHEKRKQKRTRRLPLLQGTDDFSNDDEAEHEREQLQCTASLANVTEATICNTVASYSSSSDQANDPFLSAQAAFFVGTSAVSNYLAKEGLVHVNDNDNNDNTSIAKLRFLTHLTLYLDSLSACTTSTTLDGLEFIKNAVLLQYVKVLACRRDLWRMLALYASLLPPETLLEHYPGFLCRVEGETERRGMLQDARDLFAPGQDLVLLKKVVTMHLQNDSDGPRAAPIRKMKAVLWLSHYEEHFGDALVFANTLLRQFLLVQQEGQPLSMMKSALLFMNEYWPETITATVLKQVREESAKKEEEENGDTSISVYANALAEHGALECYLQAYSAFENWQNVMSHASFGLVTDDDNDQHKFPGRLEQEIARSMERRDVIRCKRQAGQAVVKAAEQAREKMLEVLLFSGGFLCQTDDDDDKDSMENKNDDDERERLEELASLRRLCLPQIVFWLVRVYDETATWMQGFLKDGMPKLGKTVLDVVSALDSNAEESLSSSPLTPSYWLEHGLNLAVTVASDEYEIHNAFAPEDTKRFLSLMAETCVKQLQYKEKK